VENNDVVEAEKNEGLNWLEAIYQASEPRMH